MILLWLIVIPLIGGVLAEHIMPYFEGPANALSMAVTDDLNTEVYGITATAAKVMHTPERVIRSQSTGLSPLDGHTFEDIVDSPYLASLNPDPTAFAPHFDTADAGADVVNFPNLGGDAFLVVPTPRTPPTSYTHLAAFARSATAKQQHAFWRAVGSQVADRLSDRSGGLVSLQPLRQGLVPRLARGRDRIDAGDAAPRVGARLEQPLDDLLAVQPRGGDQRRKER